MRHESPFQCYRRRERKLRLPRTRLAQNQQRPIGRKRGIDGNDLVLGKHMHLLRGSRRRRQYPLVAVFDVQSLPLLHHRLVSLSSNAS